MSLPQSNQLSPRIFFCSPPSNAFNFYYASALFSQKTWSQPYLQTLEAARIPLRAYVSIFRQRCNVSHSARSHYSLVYSNSLYTDPSLVFMTFSPLFRSIAFIAETTQMHVTRPGLKKMTYLPKGKEWLSN